MIIFYILTTLSLDNVWTLLGENCCWSLLGLKGLIHYMVIYPVDSAIQCLNNQGLINMEFGKEFEFELSFTPEPSVALSV